MGVSMCVFVCGCVCVCLCVHWFVLVGACFCVGVYPWVHGCVRGCEGVGVRFGTGLCAYVVGCPPHPHTHQDTDARPHVETNTKSCIHPHANTTIHPYTNPHKPTHPTQRHTHTHVHMLPVTGVPTSVHWGGALPRVLGQMRCRREKFVRIHVNSRLGSATGLPGFGTYRFGRRSLRMFLGRDFHWMMRNEARARILTPQIPQKEPKIQKYGGFLHVGKAQHMM